MKKIIIVLVVVLVLGYVVFNKKGEDKSPIVENPTGGTVEDSIKMSIASLLEADSSSVEIVSMEEKEWSDSCLGLGGPAEICAFMMTPGYEVKVKVEGKDRTFRTDLEASVVREDK